YVARGRAAEAVANAWQATDIEDRNAATLLATGSEGQKRLYMATLASHTDRVISLHIQEAPEDMGAASLALTTLLRRKGRVLDVMTDSLAALRRSLAPDDQELADQLASVYSQLATQVSRGLRDTPPEQYRKDLVRLEQERQALEA